MWFKETAQYNRGIDIFSIRYGLSIKIDHILDHKIILNKSIAMHSMFSIPGEMKGEENEIIISLSI